MTPKQLTLSFKALLNSNAVLQRRFLTMLGGVWCSNISISLLLCCFVFQTAVNVYGAVSSMYNYNGKHNLRAHITGSNCSEGVGFAKKSIHGGRSLLLLLLFFSHRTEF